MKKHKYYKRLVKLLKRKIKEAKDLNPDDSFYWDTIVELELLCEILRSDIPAEVEKDLSEIFETSLLAEYEKE